MIFFKLIEHACQPLYLGYEEFSNLLFVIELYHLKCLCGVTDRVLDGFIKLFRRALPKVSTLASSFNKMQSIIKQFGLRYQKINLI